MIQAWPPRAGRAAHQMPVRGSGSRRSTAGPTRRQAAGDRPRRQARLPVSQPHPLTCPAFPGLADKAALRASVASCLAHLHGDLRFYTTAMFTDDASQILIALHYTTVNLIGGSYGPTAEQVFLLRHPRQVRTMTMLNGSLLTIPMFEREPWNSQQALDQVFALCQSQPACHQAFPHLAADWAALWASLGDSPWVLSATQSPTGKTERLDQDTLAAWISVSKAAQAAGLTGTGGGATPMMQYEIACAEPWASRQHAPPPDQRASDGLFGQSSFQFVSAAPVIGHSAAYRCR